MRSYIAHHTWMVRPTGTKTHQAWLFGGYMATQTQRFECMFFYLQSKTSHWNTWWGAWWQRHITLQCMMVTWQHMQTHHPSWLVDRHVVTQTRQVSTPDGYLLPNITLDIPDIGTWSHRTHHLWMPQGYLVTQNTSFVDAWWLPGHQNTSRLNVWWLPGHTDTK